MQTVQRIVFGLDTTEKQADCQNFALLASLFWSRLSTPILDPRGSIRLAEIQSRHNSFDRETLVECTPACLQHSGIARPC